jgi:hypothetical protein
MSDVEGHKGISCAVICMRLPYIQDSLSLSYEIVSVSELLSL